jgi:hypothetical protein
MKRVNIYAAALQITVCLAVVSAANVASAIVLASDNASDPAYAFEADGAWKGTYDPTDPHIVGQNPPGNDNGGTGFGVWNFTGPRVTGGSQNPVPPYGNLNHFIDGVDFPTTAYNNLGAPAFGLGNCNPGSHCYGTAVAERSFFQPMQVGDVFTAAIDTPAEYDNYADAIDGYPFAIIGFRDASRLPTFGVEAGGDVDGPGPYPWTYDDLNGDKQDFGTAAGVGPIDPTATSNGSTIRLEILSATTGRFTLNGVPLDITFKFGLPKSVVFTLYDNNAVADAMGNPTGQHAFYFNNLKIERPPFGLPGDYNGNSVVDAADYVLWRNGGPLQNEVATLGMVTPEDYNEWRSRFGNISAAGSVAGLSHGVPEPSTTSLVAAVVFTCISRRRRRM